MVISHLQVQRLVSLDVFLSRGTQRQQEGVELHPWSLKSHAVKLEQRCALQDDLTTMCSFFKLYQE